MVEAGGGTSRTARVLEPSFVGDLGGLSTDEVRGRRDDALAAREYLSYLRRLVQARIDMLQAERARRSEGGDGEGLIDRVATALAEGPKGGSRGEALTVGPTQQDMDQAERRADAAMGEASLSALRDLDEHTIERAIEGLRDEERTVSERRAEVIRVHDRLQDELKRRYREDPSQIPTDL
jgi:hypothetical protein